MKGLSCGSSHSSIARSEMLPARSPILSSSGEIFSAAMMKKDIHLASELGRELGVTLRSAELMDELLTKAIEMGWGDEDFAVLFKVVEQLSVRSEA